MSKGEVVWFCPPSPLTSRDLVLFWLLGQQIPKANFPLWCCSVVVSLSYWNSAHFLSLLPPPPKKMYKIFTLHLPVLLPPPSSLQASSAAQDGKIMKHSSLKIESISSASNHSDSLSWGVTCSKTLDSMFKNKPQLLQEAISGSIWGHSTPYPNTLKLLNDAEWLQSSSVYTLHLPSSTHDSNQQGRQGTKVAR